MRWLPLIVIFALAWIEITLFIQVAHALGVLMTMLLVIFTSALGVSLIIAGFLLLLPGFFTDFLGLLLLPPVQKHLTLTLMPHLRVWRGPGAGPDSGFTVDGEYERKDNDRIGHDDRHDR